MVAPTLHGMKESRWLMKMVQMPKLGLPSIFKLKFVELHLYEVEGDYSVNEYVIVPIWNILWISFARGLIICFTIAGRDRSIFILKYGKMQPFLCRLHVNKNSRPGSSPAGIFLYFSAYSNWQLSKVGEWAARSYRLNSIRSPFWFP